LCQLLLAERGCRYLIAAAAAAAAPALPRWGKDPTRWLAPRRFYLKLNGTIWDVTDFARCMVSWAASHRCVRLVM
jgi:hypothetical protein